MIKIDTGGSSLREKESGVSCHQFRPAWRRRPRDSIVPVSRIFCAAVIVVWLSIVTVSTYNIDTDNPVAFKGDARSYFGYSVALVNNKAGSWVITGAPRANSTKFSNDVQPGEIWKCDISNGGCSFLDLVPKEVISYSRRTNGWLGVSLDTTTGSPGVIVSCAHRWSRETNMYSDTYSSFGICYSINKEFERTSSETLQFKLGQVSLDYPSRSQWDVHKDAQLGIATHFVKNSDSLLLGAPGSYHGTGTASLMSRVNKINPGKYSKHLMPYFMPGVKYYAYFGYAVTSGKFDKNGPTKYVFGAPRQDYKGTIYIGNFNGLNQFDRDPVVINGEQIGEYYGASLCAVDLNNDNLDDLLVGAPFHTKDLEEGKVYVLISEGYPRFTKPSYEIVGSGMFRAQFGSSIAVLGDTNKDGYTDVAIGAPYENEKGVVYIYHGSANGLHPRYMQKIEAADTRGFGISISRGLDIDGNNYPDLLVGSYLSNSAYVFRSQPIIYLQAKLTSDRFLLDTDDKNCNFDDSTAASCFKLDAFVTYTGQHVPKSLNVSVTLQVDTVKGDDRSAIRVWLKSDRNTMEYRDNRMITLNVNRTTQIEYMVHAIDKPWDFMTTVESQLTYEAFPETKSPTSGFCKTCAIADRSQATVKTTKVRFARNCGFDDKCNADLSVTAYFEEFRNPNANFVIGSTNNLTLRFDIFNDGEPAYATIAIIRFPHWIDIDVKPSSCKFTSRDKHELHCNMANPLETTESVFEKLTLNLDRIPLNNGLIEVKIIVFSDSLDGNMDNNNMTLVLPVKVVSTISVTGLAIDKHVNFALDHDRTVRNGTTAIFTHLYEITNNGPSPASLVKIVFSYPAKSITTGADFLRITGLDKRFDQRGVILGTCEGTLNLTVPEEPKEVTPNNATEMETASRQRREREINNATGEKDIVKEIEPVEIEHFAVDCGSTLCQHFSCEVGPMVKGSRVSFVITATVDIKKLQPLSNDESKRIFTEALAIVAQPVTTNERLPDYPPNSAKVSTLVSPGAHLARKEPAKWIIPVSAIGGLLLLVLITTGLVKAGFFRRKQMEKMEKMKKDNNEKTGADNEICSD